MLRFNSQFDFSLLFMLFGIGLARPKYLGTQSGRQNRKNYDTRRAGRAPVHQYVVAGRLEWKARWFMLPSILRASTP